MRSSSSTTLSVSPGAPVIGGRQSKQARTVLDMRHGDVRAGTDDELNGADTLAERREVAVIPAPNEARPEDGEIPAIPFGEATSDAFLTGLRKRVPIALVEIWTDFDRTVLIERPTDGTPIVDCEAARENDATTGRARHPFEQSLRSGHCHGELRILTTRDARG